MLGLAPGDHRREEDAGRDERRRDPEQRELDVPGAHQVVGEDAREVEAEEAADVGPVVLARRPDERLDQEQRRHHEEEPGAGALRRREGDIAGRAERQRRLLAPVPAEEAPAAEDAEQDPDPAEQRDQREDAPDDHVGGRLVVDARLGRPVVGVGVVVARPLGRGRPRRPAEERGQLPQLVAVGDRVRPQPVLRRRVGEEARVVPDQPPVGLGLRGRERERAGALVVAVGAELGDRAARRAVGAGAAVPADHEVRGAAQVVGGVVRAQVGAVAEDRAVLHEAVVEEDLLALVDVRRRVEHLPRGVDHALRRRRLGHVGPVGQEPEHEEAEQHHQQDRLHPALRHQQGPPLGRRHVNSPRRVRTAGLFFPVEREKGSGAHGSSRLLR